MRIGPLFALRLLLAPLAIGELIQIGNAFKTQQTHRTHGSPERPSPNESVGRGPRKELPR